MDYVVFDLETTGLSHERDAVVEIGAVRIRAGQVIAAETFHSLVNPQRPIPFYVSRVHGLFDRDVKNAPTISQVLPQFLEFVGTHPVVAHNANFDVGFIRSAAQRHGVQWNPVQICTVQLSRQAFPGVKGHKLDDLASRLNLTFTSRHRSMGDVMVTAEAFLQLGKTLELSL